jgi:hypothetical protein
MRGKRKKREDGVDVWVRRVVVERGRVEGLG